MRIATTVPTGDPRRSGDQFAELEQLGYDTAFSFESKHDPAHFGDIVADLVARGPGASV